MDPTPSPYGEISESVAAAIAAARQYAGSRIENHRHAQVEYDSTKRALDELINPDRANDPGYQHISNIPNESAVAALSELEELVKSQAHSARYRPQDDAAVGAAISAAGADATLHAADTRRTVAFQPAAHGVSARPTALSSTSAYSQHESSHTSLPPVNRRGAAVQHDAADTSDWMTRTLPAAVLADPSVVAPRALPDPIRSVFQTGTESTYMPVADSAGMSAAERTAAHALSLLPEGSPAHELQLRHVLELARLRFEREKLEGVAALERTAVQLQLQRAQLAADAAHQGTMADQWRAYQQARLSSAVQQALSLPPLAKSAAATAMDVYAAALQTQQTAAAISSAQAEAAAAMAMAQASVAAASAAPGRTSGLSTSASGASLPATMPSYAMASAGLAPTPLQPVAPSAMSAHSASALGFGAPSSAPDHVSPVDAVTPGMPARPSPHPSAGHATSSTQPSAQPPSTRQATTRAESSRRSAMPSPTQPMPTPSPVQSGARSSVSARSSALQGHSSRAGMSAHPSLASAQEQAASGLSYAQALEARSSPSYRSALSEPEHQASPAPPTPADSVLPMGAEDAAVMMQAATRGWLARKDTQGILQHQKAMRVAASDAMSGPAFVRTAAQPPDGVCLLPGDGFDVYVDAARFLPDSVVMSKVLVRVMDSAFQQVGKEAAALSTLDSEVCCPAYNAYSAFRSKVKKDAAAPTPVAAFQPELVLVLRIDALERVSGRVQVAGYAVLNLFCKEDAVLNTEQPSADDLGTRYTLNAGAHQLPLYQRPPPADRALRADNLHAVLPRVPCASVLVRVVPVLRAAHLKLRQTSAVSTDEAGTFVRPATPRSALTRKKLPASQWSAAGLLVKPPLYREGKYDSSRCAPSESELNLFPARAAVHSVTHRAMLQLLWEQAARAEGVDPVHTLGMGLEPAMKAVPPVHDPELPDLGVPPPAQLAPDPLLIDWMRARLSPAPTALLDFTYITSYKSGPGLAVAIDSVYNLPPNTGPVIVLHSLAPWKSLYGPKASLGASGMAVNHEWNFSQKHQVFTEQWVRYADVPYDPRLVLVLDVRRVVLKRTSKWGVFGKKKGKGGAAAGAAGADPPAASGRSGRGSSMPGLPSAGPFISDMVPRPGPDGAVSAQSSGMQVVMEPLAWGLCPVFDAAGHGYVARGGFEIPLYAGPPNVQLLVALASGAGPKPHATRPYAIEALVTAQANRLQPPITLTPSGASARVRVLDAQLWDCLSVGTDHYEQDYMPDEATAAACAVPAAELLDPPLPDLSKYLPKKTSGQEADDAIAELVSLQLQESIQRVQGKSTSSNTAARRQADAPGFYGARAAQ